MRLPSPWRHPKPRLWVACCTSRVCSAEIAAGNFGQSNKLPQLVHPTDPNPVPHVPQVHSLAQVLNESRPVNGQALSAGVTHAVVHNSVRAAQLQLAAEGLRGDVAVGIIDVRHPLTPVPDVVKPCSDISQV